MNRVCWLLFVSMASLVFPQPALALPGFKKVFEGMYVAPVGDEEYAAKFKATGCATCHLKAQGKEKYNAYGKVLARLIPGDARERIIQAENKEAVQAQLNEEARIAMLQAETKEATGGGAWGELFKALKLPPDHLP